jgi:hypothetical protein
MIGHREHVPSNRLKSHLATQEPSRNPLDDTPFPDRASVESATLGQPARPFPRITLQKLDWVLTHKHTQVVLSLGQEAVGIDELEGVPGP